MSKSRFAIAAVALCSLGIPAVASSASANPTKHTDKQAHSDRERSDREHGDREHGDREHGDQKTQLFRVVLGSRNHSGASGVAHLRLTGDALTVHIQGEGFTPNLAHAQHIHGIGTGECPPANFTPSTFTRTDGTVQHFLSTGDGLPFYGPIAVSLTTHGDTSPAAGLSLAIMPVADSHGRIDYTRTLDIPENVAKNITQFVIVQHGVDFNHTGSYDFQGAGPSDLNPAVPQEATAPADCGTINGR